MPHVPSSGIHFTTAGVAELLGCSEANVRVMERNGVLIPGHVARGGLYEMSLYHRYRAGCTGTGTIVEEYMARLDWQADVVRASGMKLPRWLRRWGSGRSGEPVQRFLELGRPEGFR